MSLIFAAGLSLLPFANVAHAQSMGPRLGKSKDKKNEPSHIDPALRKIEGQLKFDDVTKAALARSNQPGEMRAEKEESQKIYIIRIVGAKKVEPDAVMLRLTSKIGQNLDTVNIAEDIHNIYKMGLFRNIEPKKEILESGAIVLEYHLTEIPTIFQVKINGNDVLSTDEIKENLAGIENYQVAESTRIQAAIEKIKELYVSKGYFLSEVSYELNNTSEEEIKKREKDGSYQSYKSSSHSPLIEIETANVAAPDFVDLVFTIKENEKVRVNRIYFTGNERLKEEEIKPELRTHEDHLLSFLTDWGTYRKDYQEIDGFIIEKFLHDRGMLKAIVHQPVVQLSPDKKFVDIGFPITENDQYSLGKITISGDKLEQSEIIFNLRKENDKEEPVFLAEKLLQEIELESGEIFNKSKLTQGIMAITERYKDKGYAYANVSPIPKFNEEEKIVDVSVAISSGPRVKIEAIEIEGNEKTKDEVIRRAVEIIEGKYYSSTSLRLSEGEINRLGYFERVEISNRPGSAPDLMIITIKVKEQNTGNIQAGAGYGTGGEGIVLRGQISNQNLFGRGQTLSAQVNWSNYRKEFDLMFIEPYLTYMFGHPLTFAFTAFNRQRVMGEFTRNAVGGDITFGYPVGSPFAKYSRKWKAKADPALVNYVFDFESLLFYLTYTLERVEINDLTTDARKWNLFQGVPRYTTSLRPTLRLDQRDNRLYPTRGLYFEARTDLAWEYFGAVGLTQLENYIRRNRPTNRLSDGRDYLKPPSESNNFVKYGLNFRAYHNLDDWFFIKGLVLKANLEMGILDTLGKPLLFENFALGGPSTLRGYSYRSISPTERTSPLFPFDARRDLMVGGNKQFYGSVELEFPIIKPLKIGGVIFFDFGNAFSHEDNFFYIGGKSDSARRVNPTDPLRLYEWMGLYSSVGFGLRWQSPLGYLRFEWGIPLNRRPASTPGLGEEDRPIGFEFSIGPSF